MTHSGLQRLIVGVKVIMRAAETQMYEVTL